VIGAPGACPRCRAGDSVWLDRVRGRTGRGNALMPIERDGEGPPLRRPESKVSLTPGEGRGGDLRATPFTDDVFSDDYYGQRPSRPESSRSLSVVIGVALGIVVAGGAGWYVLRGSGLTFTPGAV